MTLSTPPNPLSAKYLSYEFNGLRDSNEVLADHAVLFPVLNPCLVLAVYVCEGGSQISMKVKPLLSILPLVDPLAVITRVNVLSNVGTMFHSVEVALPGTSLTVSRVARDPAGIDLVIAIILYFRGN